MTLSSELVIFTDVEFFLHYFVCIEVLCHWDKGRMLVQQQ